MQCTYKWSKRLRCAYFWLFTNSFRLPPQQKANSLKSRHSDKASRRSSGKLLIYNAIFSLRIKKSSYEPQFSVAVRTALWASCQRGPRIANHDSSWSVVYRHLMQNLTTVIRLLVYGLWAFRCIHITDSSSTSGWRLTAGCKFDGFKK